MKEKELQTSFRLHTFIHFYEPSGKNPYMLHYNILYIFLNYIRPFFKCVTWIEQHLQRDATPPVELSQEILHVFTRKTTNSEQRKCFYWDSF